LKEKMKMSNEHLTATEARQIQKDANAALKKIFKQHPNRDRSSIADVENPNRQIRKSDCEVALSALHTRHDSGRAIAKAPAPATTNAGAAISALHSDGSFAGREIAGNGNLVAKLASAIGQAALKDYGSAREAKREIKKLLSEDAPRPRNYEIVKRAQAKSGIATMTLRKGSAYPFLIEVDGYYHSEHFDADGAERAFIVLCAGVN
jgi:uncharacterized protein YecA (UPF0149 family)